MITLDQSQERRRLLRCVYGAGEEITQLEAGNKLQKLKKKNRRLFR